MSGATGKGGCPGFGGCLCKQIDQCMPICTYTAYYFSAVSCFSPSCRLYSVKCSVNGVIFVSRHLPCMSPYPSAPSVRQLQCARCPVAIGRGSWQGDGAALQGGPTAGPSAGAVVPPTHATPQHSHAMCPTIPHKCDVSRMPGSLVVTPCSARCVPCPWN